VIDYSLLLARHSLQWHEENLYSFMWNTRMVFVRYDRATRRSHVLTWHDPVEDLPELYEFINAKLAPVIEEMRIDDEESRDRSR